MFLVFVVFINASTQLERVLSQPLPNINWPISDRFELQMAHFPRVLSINELPAQFLGQVNLQFMF